MTADEEGDINMQTKRLFLGVFADKHIFDDIYSSIKKDFDKVTFGKWVEPENLHFTIKFLGDVNEDQIETLRTSLTDCLGAFEYPLIITSTGTLPDNGAPRILYSKVKNFDGGLLPLVKHIENILDKEGFEKEKRAFIPHITLQRIKSSTNDFRSVLNKYKDYPFGIMDSFRINLIESRLSSAGPVYKIIE